MEALQSLSRSKRFWTAVVGLFFMVGVELVPGLEENASQLQETALYIIGLLIGGYSLQDAAQSYRSGNSKYDAQ